ncbi:hypothetical protein CC80DRAFT_542682 [Byssothecium circinans]|uniref:Uncharacterized protein n=1 Tax=Byssothecium circinans TaxID=147558 RepID=A0A6A5UCA2_9PLEO|nr:hypothetical protein CC80DRAFT_542682 [Byssothecium circinans]
MASTPHLAASECQMLPAENNDDNGDDGYRIGIVRRATQGSTKARISTQSTEDRLLCLKVKIGVATSIVVRPQRSVYDGASGRMFQTVLRLSLRPVLWLQPSRNRDESGQKGDGEMRRSLQVPMMMQKWRQTSQWGSLRSPHELQKLFQVMGDRNLHKQLERQSFEGRVVTRDIHHALERNQLSS